MTSYIDKNHRGRVSSLNGRGRRFSIPLSHLFALHRYIQYTIYIYIYMYMYIYHHALFREFACGRSHGSMSMARLSLARRTCCRRGSSIASGIAIGRS